MNAPVSTLKLEMILATVDPIYNEIAAPSKCLVLRTPKDFSPEHLVLAPRHSLDKTPEWRHARQLIAYILVQDEEGKILTYRRTTEGGENLLHGSVSIGWGGHTDLEDINVYPDAPSRINVEGTLSNAALRELHEELGLEPENFIVHPNTLDVPPARKCMIISNEDAVGQVHVGLVYKVCVSSNVSFKVENTGKLLGFKTLEEIQALGEALEGWTANLLGELISSPDEPVPDLI
ncbi:MAG: hypothetical protein ACRC6V_03935 [Bacteroidales bacterium]